MLNSGIPNGSPVSPVKRISNFSVPIEGETTSDCKVSFEVQNFSEMSQNTTPPPRTQSVGSCGHLEWTLDHQIHHADDEEITTLASNGRADGRDKKHENLDHRLRSSSQQRCNNVSVSSEGSLIRNLSTASYDYYSCMFRDDDNVEHAMEDEMADDVFASGNDDSNSFSYIDNNNNNNQGSMSTSVNTKSFTGLFSSNDENNNNNIDLPFSDVTGSNFRDNNNPNVLNIFSGSANETHTDITNSAQGGSRNSPIPPVVTSSSYNNNNSISGDITSTMSLPQNSDTTPYIPVRPNSTDTTSSPPSLVIKDEHLQQQHHHHQMLYQSEEDLTSSLATAASRAVQSGRLSPLLKIELKYLIQSRRLSEGKREMAVSFDPPIDAKLSTSEQARVERRRHQNREAARRFREKRKLSESALLQRIQELQDTKARLIEEAQQLRDEKQLLMEIVADHLLVCPSLGQLHLEDMLKETVP